MVSRVVFPISGWAVNDQTGDRGAGERDCTASAADGTGERQARRLEEELVWLCILVSLRYPLLTHTFLTLNPLEVVHYSRFAGTSQMGKKENKLNFYGAGKTNVILAASCDVCKEIQTVVIHLYTFFSQRYRFKEYAIPWYMNKRYKRKKFYTPSFVQPHIRWDEAHKCSGTQWFPVTVLQVSCVYFVWQAAHREASTKDGQKSQLGEANSGQTQGEIHSYESFIIMKFKPTLS